MKTNTIYIILLALVAWTTGYAQTLDNAKLDQFFDRLAEKNKAMGSLLIAKNGTILYNRSIGYSQIIGTDKKPFTSATKSRIGSVTKMFTAAMIVQLIDQGKLSLNTTLDTYFPQLPNAGKITVEHILAHRSGIHDISENQDFRAKRLDGLPKDALLNMMAQSKPDFEPDAKSAYSNTGFQVLGMLIEKVTGKSYQENLSQRITSNIGLKDTYVGTGSIDVRKNESFSYRYGRDWEPQPDTHGSLLFGSGDLVSTPTDMSKFIQALFDGKLVSQKSLSQMMEKKLGMDTFTYNGKTGYGHTGGVDGFGSWLVYLPDEKLVVSYATNGKVYPVSNIIDGVFDIYVNKPFQIPTFDTVAISPEILDKYVGVYTISGAPVKFTVTREGTTLFIQMTGQNVIPLEPAGTDTFKIESAGIVFEFDVAKNQMTQKRSGRERVLTKEN